MEARGRQISVRVRSETDAWLERRSGGRRNKAEFIRGLIEKEMLREKEEELLEMFNKAAADLTAEDRAERELLLGGFSGRREEPESRRRSRK